MVKSTETRFRIGDVITTNIDTFVRAGELQMKIKDIVYRYSDIGGYWAFIIEKSNSTKQIEEIPYIENNYNLKEKVCPDCLYKGSINKYNFKCDTENCNTDTYEGMTYQFSTNKITTKEKPNNIIDSNNPHRIVIYSVKKKCWCEYNLESHNYYMFK